MNVRLVGEANDYVGKGLCGGRLTVVPPSSGNDPWQPGDPRQHLPLWRHWR